MKYKLKIENKIFVNKIEKNYFIFKNYYILFLLV